MTVVFDGHEQDPDLVAGQLLSLALILVCLERTSKSDHESVHNQKERLVEVCHQIYTILDVVKRRLPALDDPEVFSRIESNVQSLSETVLDLLDLALPSSERP